VAARKKTDSRFQLDASFSMTDSQFLQRRDLQSTSPDAPAQADRPQDQTTGSGLRSNGERTQARSLAWGESVMSAYHNTAKTLNNHYNANTQVNRSG
jgi:hypothetical protein